MKALTVAAPVISCTMLSAGDGQKPPVAPCKDHVQVWHGEKVNDPWFWLREKESPDVVNYLQAENAYTEALAQDLKPFSEVLYKEFLSHIKQTDMDVPTRIGRFYYYARTSEGEQYPVHCRKAAASDLSFDDKAHEEVLLDQNALAKGLKFLSVGDFCISNDGTRMLYTTDVTGFRQYRLYSKDLATGKTEGPLADRVSTFDWASDSATAFYVTDDEVTKRSDTLWRLRLGEKSEKVWEEKDPLFNIWIGHTSDRKYLILSSMSTDTWEKWYLDASTPTQAFKVVLPREKGHKYELNHRDGLFYIRTNKGAKNFKIVTAPVSDPSQWKELVPHKTDVLLEMLYLHKDYAVVCEQFQTLNHFRILDFRTGIWRTIKFPEEVYSAFGGWVPEFDNRMFRVGYQSMLTPFSIYEYDLDTLKPTLLKQQEVPGGYDPSHYASERLWATARDGTKIPISIVYPKNFRKDGNAPLWLYAYGSYGIGEAAYFDSKRVTLMDRGLAYAVVHIRGGNEMGEAWHDDGMLLKKKNTFNDFIDCAEYLIKEKWTAKDRLVINGGSAGGLLMGATTNMRPDLFKAVLMESPFVDVMNTMMDASLPLTVGEYLEWGNPNEKAAFDYMRSYSPYDNLQRKAYPSMLVTTSYNDSQVMYWEPAKYVAKLRTMKTDSNPLLLKCKMDPAGHHGASGRYDKLKDTAFNYAWMLQQLGITK
jgi:oligopeptidase B